MEIKCSFCGRPATRLCDAPIGRAHYLGHPPRHLMLKAKFCETAWTKVDMDWTVTCDRAICERCATRISADIDFCPDCVREIKTKSGGRRWITKS